MNDFIEYLLTTPIETDEDYQELGDLFDEDE
jgi:hypothetical protein